MTGIVVTGVARGGTSLFAGICDGLGIPMGKHGPRFENPYLQWAVLAERWDVVGQLIKTIESEQGLWGWKLPALYRELPRVSNLVTNPRFIFAVKDPVSVARRRADPSDAQRFAKMIRRNAQALDMMGEFAVKTGHPTLFVSYGDAISNLPGTVEDVAAFCGLDCTASRANEVAEKIRVNHQGYLGGTYRGRTRSPLDKKLSRICADAGVAAPSGQVTAGVDT